MTIQYFEDEISLLANVVDALKCGVHSIGVYGGIDLIQYLVHSAISEYDFDFDLSKFNFDTQFPILYLTLYKNGEMEVGTYRYDEPFELVDTNAIISMVNVEDCGKEFAKPLEYCEDVILFSFKDAFVHGDVSDLDLDNDECFTFESNTISKSYDDNGKVENITETQTWHKEDKYYSVSTSFCSNDGDFLKGIAESFDNKQY
ncbi:MAG: hypothetical protein ACLTBR_03420 [Anaerostipes sp.]|uniref:hypothetical protein n=1 Tax=Anaerostipes sp. TaxID=1872530 RepID=UPI003994F246